MLRVFCLIAALSPTVGRTCELALILMIDVSSSIDPAEYRFQADGLATALLDPEIGDILLRDQIALSVVQWSGGGEQEMSVPWRRMLNEQELVDFSDRVHAMPRAWNRSSTAIGNGIRYALNQFEAVSDCKRKVIDVSGDGPANIGIDTSLERQKAEIQGVEINGLAIDELGLSVTEFYRRFVITKGGFVETSRGYLSYPETIRRKLLRELIEPTT